MRYWETETGFEDWLGASESELGIEWSESGRDIEPGADWDLFVEERYNEYLRNLRNLRNLIRNEDV